MIRVLFNTEFVVRLRQFRVVGAKEMKSLTIAEVGSDTFRIELASVFEVLHSFRVLTQLAE